MNFLIKNSLEGELKEAFEFISSKKGWNITSDENADNLIIIGDTASDPSGVSAFLNGKDMDGNWYLVYQTDKGFYVSGKRKVDIIHAALRAVDYIRYPEKAAVREFKVSAFKKYFENYDDFSFAFARAADDFDLEKHMIDMVRVGVENFEINMLYDDIPIQVREREHSNDVYPWWCSYMPTMEMYYETSISKGIYDDEMLAQNRAVLLNAVRLCRLLGLKPMFTVFEPRFWPERLFRKYPETRGARVDRDTYSTTPEYAPDITHPIVLKHYRELMTQLMADVPDLAMYEIWSQDSNAGFPWAKSLYQKANGPTRIFGMPFHQIVNTFLVTLRDVARETNPETRIHLNIDWCYQPDEKVELIENLPEGIGLTFGYRLNPDGNIENLELIKKLPEGYTQVLSEQIGNYWKKYGPLVGFPTPREAHKIVSHIYKSGIDCLTMRGGIHTDVFVPYNVNNELIREMKYNPDVDVEEFLVSVAEKWSNNEEEKQALIKTWKICDRFNLQHEETRKHCGHYLSWTSPMFVSSRTLFRKLVMPIVPDTQSLTFQETRYYKPHVFFCAKTDPSWHDISFFNFTQVDEDEKLVKSAEDLEKMLIPWLMEVLDILGKVKKYGNPVIIDLYDRVKAFYHISVTEKILFAVQYLVHMYPVSDGEEKKKIRACIRAYMEEEIENTEGFIKLLRETESVLIPTTSGEETTYMYKTPMDNLLVRKIKVMKSRMDDEPVAVSALAGSRNDYLYKF